MQELGHRVVMFNSKCGNGEGLCTNIWVMRMINGVEVWSVLKYRGEVIY